MLIIQGQCSGLLASTRVPSSASAVYRLLSRPSRKFAMPQLQPIGVPGGSPGNPHQSHLISPLCTKSMTPSSADGKVTRHACPVCAGTGFKPCGQCNGTGANQEDKFGGSIKAGDPCWLCEGSGKTMCGQCIDLTDSF